MKAATLSDIKKELDNSSPAKLLELCVRLARYKKDNKELLYYLLFESHDSQQYINSIKEEMDEAFAGMNKSNLYLAKKSLRKILRTLAKYSRYIASAEAETTLLLYFCGFLKHSAIPLKKSVQINNLYLFQIKKLTKLIAVLHEDLQYDYLKELNKLLD